jgi:transcriptional regulator with XRE-family HTH domain
MAGVGERIKARRLELEWTQDQLAKKVSMPSQFRWTMVALPTLFSRSESRRWFSRRILRFQLPQTCSQS